MIGQQILRLVDGFSFAVLLLAQSVCHRAENALLSLLLLVMLWRLARGVEESFFILRDLGRLTRVSDDLLEVRSCMLVLPDKLLVYG